MTVDKYILADRKPVLCESLENWAAFMANDDNRRVAYDMLGDVRISTRFMGLDVRLLPEDKLELFETLISGGVWDSYIARSNTWEDAVDSHAGAIKLVQSEEAPDEPLPD